MLLPLKEDGTGNQRPWVCSEQVWFRDGTPKLSPWPPPLHQDEHALSKASEGGERGGLGFSGSSTSDSQPETHARL